MVKAVDGRPIALALGCGIIVAHTVLSLPLVQGVTDWDTGAFVVSRSSFIFATLILSAIVLGLAYLIWKRRRWARVVYTVDAALGLAAQAWSVLVLGWSLAAVVNSILLIATIILLFHPTSNAWMSGREGGAGQPTQSPLDG